MQDKRVWLYCRVAHEDAAALENQKQLLLTYAEKKGYKIVGVTSEAGSGMTMDRPGWNNIIKAAETQTMDAVMAVNCGRIARNTIEYLKCESRLSAYRVAIETVQDNGVWKKPAVCCYLRMAKQN